MNLTEQELFERYGKKFPAGSVLFEEDDEGDETYIILTGSIRIIKRMKQGDRTLAVIPADEFVGEMATLLNEPRSATAIVEEEAKLLVINSNTFESMVKANSGIAYRIIKKLAERIKNSNKQLEIMMFKDANRKVVYGLVNASDKGEKLPDDQGILVTMSVDYLASITGVVNTKVREVLDKLSTANLITPVSNGYIVSDKKKLFKFLEYLAMKEQVGEFSADALKTIITEQRLNADDKSR